MKLELKISQKITKKKIESLKILELNTFHLKNYLKVNYGVEERELSYLSRKERSLEEFLLEQVGLLKISRERYEILEEFIWNLDEKGYLKLSLTDLAKKKRRSILYIRECYETFKELDPKGIGGRDMREVLILQSEKKSILRGILEDMYRELMDINFPKISKRLGISMEEIKNEIEPMRYFISYPRKNFAYYAPVEIREDDIFLGEDLEVTLNSSYGYRVSEEDVQGGSVRTAEKINTALAMREATLFKVAKFIVEHQRSFLTGGEMKSLKLEDVAEALGVSISTVSRTIRDKRLNHQGTRYNLKDLFTNQVGETTSYTVKRVVQEIVDSEDKSNPLSDEEIRQKMIEKGMEISRRTVGKYRNQMEIPSMKRRRRY
ncbi:hypothetical protein PM10SUCC1_18080 [Propionigenium maris DSM 9537]|uniref:RNA polymerase, sigma 54 subunit, RpoN/SigL n=1 Tax=Propionigenium maris DSM 9537 TaxID=1123000 RepID=A0A9W6GM05_9FUSO|nr:LacI family DNA-binding transcriptional regulator [Propionigenium maris]GLI56294.1 hypothetical protein PM10SUCC1_18080 [Propionigenium maris DSM 9537]